MLIVTERLGFLIVRRPCQQLCFHISALILHEQVKCVVHGSAFYSVRNLNQEPRPPVPMQGCQPCENVQPFTKIYCTNLMCNN